VYQRKGLEEKERTREEGKETSSEEIVARKPVPSRTSYRHCETASRYGSSHTGSRG
jgi:hypothetical protein